MGKYKILVVGESCNDYFMYGKVTRTSPEGKGPVFLVTKTTHNSGMAANTAANLKALGVEVDTFFCSGNINKIRYVDEQTNELCLRADTNDQVGRINTKDLPNLANYNAIIISDYCKGFLTQEDISTIASTHKLVILDTKKQLGEWCKSIAFIKLNRQEYLANREYAKCLEDKLISTLDKEGACYKGEIFPTKFIQNPDVSGAGDTFIAAFALEYLKTTDVRKSIVFANEISSIVVSKKGVAVP